MGGTQKELPPSPQRRQRAGGKTTFHQLAGGKGTEPGETVDVEIVADINSSTQPTEEGWLEESLGEILQGVQCVPQAENQEKEEQAPREGEAAAEGGEATGGEATRVSRIDMSQVPHDYMHVRELAAKAQTRKTAADTSK